MSRKLIVISVSILGLSGVGLLVSCASETAPKGEIISKSKSKVEPISNQDGWIINNSHRSPYIFEDSSKQKGVLYDVQSANRVTRNGKIFTNLKASGIPKFDTEVTSLIQKIGNTRPNAAGGDFVRGSQISAKVGETIVFGQNIGFVSSNNFCGETGGEGYWPPGPACPQEQSYNAFITLEPEPTEDDCLTGLGAIGYWINGSAIFNWGDGQAYNSQGGQWYQLAPVAEYYDVDICMGHSARGAYHLHNYSICLANLVDDTGSEHSPVVGYSMDGYAVHGPWESAGVLAKSGWAVRDYAGTAAQGACPDGKRSCVLNDEYYPSRGVSSAKAPGPDFDEIVSTGSGNRFTAYNGYYYEDHYYTGAEVVGAQLDQHNGHDTLDGRGYHYHVSIKQTAEGMFPAFPYSFGPKFYGEIDPISRTRCAATVGGNTRQGGQAQSGQRQGQGQGQGRQAGQRQGQRNVQQAGQRQGGGRRRVATAPVATQPLILNIEP